MENICKCPLCDGYLVRKKYMKDGEEKEFIGCTNWKETGCKGSFPSQYLGSKLSDATIKELVENGETKKPVSLKIKLRMEDGKIKMNFK